MANNNFIHDIVSPGSEPERPERNEKMERPVLRAETQRSDRDTLVPREELTSSEEAELSNVNREIDSNPFLMRYARHTVTQESEVKPPRPENTQAQEIPAQVRVPKTNFRKTPRQGTSRTSGGKGVWIVAFLCLAGLLYALSFVFVKATVTVTPYSEPISLNEKFEAKKDASTGLPFSVMAVELEDSTEIVASGSTTEDKTGTGRVILYNAYSSSPQNLLINTRLEASNGKIYMTDTAVSIPGYTKSGTTVIPGQIEVGIHATESGESYNIGLTDFKFVGFKGQTEKYAKFYARSKTPVEGGSTGLVHTITAEERDLKEAELLAELKTRAESQVKAEVPEGYLVFNDALFYDEGRGGNSLQSKETSVPIKVSIKATAFIFPVEALVKSIGERTTLATHSDKVFQIQDLETFTFSLDGREVIQPSSVNSITFTLSGEGTAYAKVDTGEFAKSLLTRKVRDVDAVLTNFPSILSAKVAMHPLWQRRFPDSLERINVLLAN